MTREELIRRKKEKALTVKELSRLSGVPAGTINKIITGETGKPRPDTMKALESVLLPRYDWSFSEVTRLAESGAGGLPFRQNEYTVYDLEHLPSGMRAELTDGRLYFMEAPSICHQKAAEFIRDRVESHIREKGGKCLTVLSPGVREEENEKDFFIPDFAVVCDPGKVKGPYIVGAPDFILEVVSPSSARRDKLTKTDRYERMGVREYWILDILHRQLITYDYQGEITIRVQGLSGKTGLSLFGGRPEIDLDELRKIIELFSE